MKRVLQLKPLAFFLFSFLMGSFLYAQESKPQEQNANKVPYEGLVLKMNENWKLKFSGLVNTFYTSSMEAGTEGKESTTYHSIQNGLNGALLKLNPTYTEGNTTITGNFMFSLGINSHGFQGEKSISGFTFSSVDVRQASATISNTNFGSVTFGRDFGLLGLDAILQDITFLGVGANWNFANPSYVTLAGIGYGYVFVDKFAQITYTTPKLFNALSVSLGVFEPYKLVGFSKIPNLDTIAKPKGLGVHGKINFQTNLGSTAASSIHLSSSFSTQKISEYNKTSDGKFTDNDLQGFGIDAFANLKLHGFNLTGYYYHGNGAGSDGFMFRPIVEIAADKVKTVKSNSYYGQVTYTTSNPKPWTFGFIYGSTTTSDVINEAKTDLVEGKESKRISGVIGFQLNPYVALRTEYTYQTAGLFAPAPNYNIFVLGGTFYF